MINKIINKYRKVKIKNQMIYDLSYFFAFYMIILIVFVLSEGIFYHTTNIRYKFFILLTSIPIILIAYSLIKSIINVKSFNNNMTDEKLAQELGKILPLLSDKILNILQLSKKEFKNPLRLELSKNAINKLNNQIQKENLNDIIPRLSFRKLLIPIITIFTITILILISNENQNSLVRIYNYNYYFAPPTPFTIITKTKHEDKYPSGSDVSTYFSIKGQSPKNIILKWFDKGKIESLIIERDNNQEYHHTFYNV